MQSRWKTDLATFPILFTKTTWPHFPVRCRKYILLVFLLLFYSSEGSPDCKINDFSEWDSGGERVRERERCVCVRYCFEEDSFLSSSFHSSFWWFFLFSPILAFPHVPVKSAYFTHSLNPTPSIPASDELRKKFSSRHFPKLKQKALRKLRRNWMMEVDAQEYVLLFRED